MIVTGEGMLVERNLIMHNLWPGSYEGRREQKNFFYEASFNLEQAGAITFRDNIVSVTLELIKKLNICIVNKFTV